jgi:diguanylate cyclase (GGDEF)-like protein
MKILITNDSPGNRHETNAILQVLLDYLPSGVTLFGPDLEMIACNKKLRELLDFPDELFSHGLPSLPTLARFNAMRGDYGPGDPEEITAAAIERTRTMKPHVFERTRPNGVVLEVRGTPLPGGGFVTIYTDITERKQMEDQVRQLAFYDTLTELPNRRLLDDRLSQTMAASKRSGCHGALMFLDLDNFKPLNDTHGHEAGDLLLIEAAARLKSCVRETDTVARFGGDEFVVMLSDLNADKTESTSQAGMVAENIRFTLSAPYLLTIKHEGKADTTVEHHCTASIGVALFINHEDSRVSRQFRLVKTPTENADLGGRRLNAGGIKLAFTRHSRSAGRRSGRGLWRESAYTSHFYLTTFLSHEGRVPAKVVWKPIR